MESMVLLENRDGFLPLTEGEGKSLGIVGRLAMAPRVQGVGSSQVRTTRVDSALPYLTREGTANGFTVSAWTAKYEETGLNESQKSALESCIWSSDVVLAFVGQRASQDSEAADRTSIQLSPADLQILEAVKAAGKPFGVVLVGGASIDVRPFANEARAILMSWLGGQAYGSAIADVIFGKRSPGGKLSETFARRVTDHPSALNFPGGPEAVEYGEGIWIGYRYFSTFDVPVAYPFGHGLSYTTFEYTEAKAPSKLASPESFDVTVNVRNAGARRGTEIVQVYARSLEASAPRPALELVGFGRVVLDAGETGTVSIGVDARDLGYYSEVYDAWIVEPGRYELLVGASSADIRSTLPLTIESGDVPERVFTLDDVFGDVLEDPQGRVVTDLLLRQFGKGPFEVANDDDHFMAVLRNLPFRKLRNFSNGAMGDAAVAKLLEIVNSDLTPDEVKAELQRLMEQRKANAGG